MTDDELDSLHDNIDCWSGYGLGARFDYRAFARKVLAAERARIKAANDSAIRAGVQAFQSGYKDSDPLADWRAFLSAVLDRA